MGLTGDWNKLERMLSQAGDKLKRNVERATKQSAKIIVAAVVTRIEQGKGFARLSPKYQAAKAKAGYDVPKILQREGELLKRGIQSKILDWQSGMVTAKRIANGVNIAAVHEFGSPKMKIPPRPFMTAGCKDAEPDVIAAYEKAIEDTFK